MKEILRIYAKIVVFFLLPLLCVISLITLFIITYVNNSILEVVLAVAAAIVIGPPAIWWGFWLATHDIK